MNARQFGARLKRLRTEAGMTQAQLAAKAGVALRTVSSLEQGLYEPVLSTFLALAGALGVDCLAFTKADDSEGNTPEKQSRGRPPKPKEEQEQQPKRPRGRPRKIAWRSQAGFSLT